MSEAAFPYGSTLPAAAHGILPSAALAHPYASSLRSATMDRKSECREAQDVRERLYLLPCRLIAPARPCAPRYAYFPVGIKKPRLAAELKRFSASEEPLLQCNDKICYESDPDHP
jgi:hypothetical protein